MKFLVRINFYMFFMIVSASSYGVTQEEAVNDYIDRAGDRWGRLEKTGVFVVREKINNDASFDLEVYDRMRCLGNGCVFDIYLCKSGDENCSSGDYCFAGSLNEGKELKAKGSSLKCSESANEAGSK